MSPEQAPCCVTASYFVAFLTCEQYPAHGGPVEGLVTAAATEEAADASPTVYARAATRDRVDREQIHRSRACAYRERKATVHSPFGPLCI